MVANKFNNYFVNVSQNLLKGLGEMNNQFQDYLKNPNEHSFFLRETTPDEVAGLLKIFDTIKLVICIAYHLNLSRYLLM